MRGRKPKPAAVLKLEKGKLYDQQARRLEYEPKPYREIIPRCPKTFSKEERKHWKYFSQILKVYGLFSVANAPILEMLSMNRMEYLFCRKKMHEMGGSVVRIGDEITTNPFFKTAMKLEERMMDGLKELGLSSVGMARLGSLLSAKAKPRSGMESLLD